MNVRRQKVLVEPPASAASDIAFILIIFFLVCASVQPDSGRAQSIPRTEETEDKKQQTKNIEIMLTEQGSIVVNGQSVPTDQVVGRLKQLLRGKSLEGDRVVTVKSTKQTPYELWIKATALIEEGGGIVTLQLEKDEVVEVD